MKRLFIISALIWQASLSFAQTDNTATPHQRWTIGTILMSEQQNYFQSKFKPSFINGMLLKYHFNDISVRAAFEYQTSIEPNDVPACCDQIDVDGYVKEGSIRLGIEKGYTFAKYYRPYLGLDLVGIKSYSEKTMSGGIAGTSQYITTRTNGFGLMTSLGFEFKLTKLLSLAVETRFRLIYNKETKDTDTLYDSYGAFRAYHNELIKTFNRIGALSLNFNF